MSILQRRSGRTSAEGPHAFRLLIEPTGTATVVAVHGELDIATVDGLRSAHHLFSVVLGEEADRDAFRAELAKHGVQTSLHYPPVHRFSIYAEAAAGAELPLTDAYAARTVTLPLFAHMSAEQQDLVIESVEAALGLNRSGAAAGRPA